MMSQMQMLGLFGMAPTVTPEIHRIMFENQLAMANPFLASALWNLPVQPTAPQLQLQGTKVVEPQVEARPREEQPLDLSRKSGLEAIIDIETANYSHKQRKHQQHQQNFTSVEKESTGSEELIRNGYGMKRNYSQVDLTAAVNDIRCGRLGTRRASTPVTDCSSISPSSDGTEGEKTDNPENRWDSDWTTNLWQSLFSQTAVKERNLLRKKKDSPPVKEISLMQEPIASLDISEESSSPAITV
ncbi:unnamed protein product [Strongylus vulgaris]|uniref:Uncharacterized protein n=1 Tax=Strongylus vulgaris TaxID=40348 RepID=A0A3P7JIH2_STRVU|nr:unnamed protein product [Strongylus vulgaris]